MKQQQIHRPVRNRFSSLTLFLISLAFLLSWSLSAATADGFTIVRPSKLRPFVEDELLQLAVKYHNVDINIRDQVAKVKIDQRFDNINRFAVEGEYIFPIPDGAAVSDFVLYVDGRPIHAQAMDAERALKIYQELVRERQDPALLEYAGRELFRARISPIPADEFRRVQLEYDHLIERENGLYRFVYPLSTEKFSSRPLESASITIELDADRPIRNAYCPSHEVDIEYLEANRLRLTWEESGTTPDRDLVLFYSLDDSAIDLRFVPYRPSSGEDGYFMLLASMGIDEKNQAEPKRIIFTIDCSGSMEGEKMNQARKALLYCLDRLTRQDHFAVVSFSNEVDASSSRLRPATISNIEAAKDFVRDLYADGGTNLAGALTKSVAISRSSRGDSYIIFLTDGLPTVGEEDPDRIIASLMRGSESKRKSNDRRGPIYKIFPFGVGYDVNTRLLDQLADQFSGVPEYIRPTEAIHTRIEGFFSKIAEPLMTNVEIKIRGVDIEDLQPSTLPDIYRGGQLVLFGRYSRGGKVKVKLSGNMGNRRRTFTFDAKLPRQNSRNDFVGRLWAMRQVGALLREVRLYGEEADLVDEVRELGLRFGIATPYTSFLVDDVGEELADAEKPMWRNMRPISNGSAKKQGFALSPPASAQIHDAVTGRAAVNLSGQINEMATAETESKVSTASSICIRAGRHFTREGDRWVEAGYQEGMDLTEIEVNSDAYYELLASHSELGPVLALGENLLFQIGGNWYRVSPA